MKGSRFHIALILMILSLTTLGQTKIAVPSTRVNFSDMGNSSNLKEQKKAAKLDARFKKQQMRSIKKLIKQNTNLPGDSIRKLTTVLPALDSNELKLVHRDLSYMVSIPEVPTKPQYTDLKKQISSQTVQDQLPNTELPDELTSISQYGKEDLPGIPSTDLEDYKKELPNEDLDLPSYSSPDSMIMQSMESRISQYMNKATQSKLEGGIDLNPPTPEPVSQVKQYIPSLEKFNYKKPKIPEDKLAEAIVKTEIERKKDELIPFRKGSEVKQKGRKQRQRIKIGGYAQYNAPTRSIEVTPSLGILLTDKWLIGGGFVTNIPLRKDSVNTRQRGYRAYMEYTIINGFYVHLESEWMTRKQNERPTIRQRSTYLGIGKNLGVGKLSSDILVLYNFSTPNALEQKQLTIRFGINFNR